VSLIAGTRIGSYEIIAQIGLGGMGEVYRATDRNLKRQVAIKVLPKAVAADAERLVRFQREAEVLASLNHPNIAIIHGLEKSDGVTGLVMELVEGPTLADRIAQGPVPIDDVLPIAQQIAAALEAAHEHGIIHRDLKPANIKVRLDGMVKVLDFGLAKAFEATPGDPGVTSAPTLTSPAMTQTGAILGTAAYMAPEQAKGRAVDKRVDIWAFGCVLYEMVTGRRAFAGEDVTDTLTSIMRDVPDLSQLPSGTFSSVRYVLGRCLEKNANLRLRDIGEARILLQGQVGGESESAVTPARSRARHLVLAAAAALVVGVIAGFAGFTAWPPMAAPAKPVVRFSLPMLPSVPLFRGPGGSLTFSRDGRLLVYVVRPEGLSRSDLRLRRFDAEHDEPIRGTEGGFAPFFSPDGRWIGFFADQKLKKIAVAGGPPTTICDQGRFSRAVWTDDGAILLGTSQGSPSGGSLARVSEAGGTPVDFTRLVPSRDRFHQSPQMLPDRRHFLFTSVGSEGSKIALGSLDTGEHRVLFDGSFGTWLPPNRILFAKGTELFAVPFDLRALAVSGAVERVLEDATTLEFARVVSIPLVAIDDSGSIAYAPLQASKQATLVRADNYGRLTALPATPAAYVSPRLSPDGSRIAVAVEGDERRSEIWIVDTARGTRLLLTPQGGRFQRGRTMAGR
jgi:eukaryotic-like serine/threonine-protein kinase